ncbi:exosome complex component RRP41-like [Actinia tenebrosa]|uniref:Putative exosome complex component RRP41 n=1 Tax=Actinia tenebrosa TaxID=6105 RepID=A0A6P8ISD4_ACTTE|nr:exosome complex component RRP41-like [Actinia tenebrosa]
MAGLEILSPEGLRLDGRRPHELRKIVCRVGVLSQADGSAYIEMGNTKALATVYGPHEVTSKAKALHDRVLLNCQFGMATFSTGERKRKPRGDRKSTELSMIIRRTFEAAIITELYPRSQIDIFVQVLQADGSNQAACINATTLALIDAGIPMKDYVSASTVSFVNDTPLMDINYLEESSGGPQLSLAILPKSEKVVLFQMDSRLHMDNMEKVLKLAVKGCKDVYTLLRRTIHEKAEEDSQSVSLT